MTTLRPELPPLPPRMRSLPVDRRGYPVPWFVEWINGEPDFRVIGSDRLVAAINGKRCWICGGELGRFHAFVIGPMCVVNRITSEPPCHLECATFAATACPFLVRPHAKRRAAGMPEEAKGGAGIMIERNPGVSCVYVTRSESWFRVHAEPGVKAGVLCELGEPSSVAFYAEGKSATREAVEESIRSGLPILEAEARNESERDLLKQMIARAMLLLPLPDPTGKP